MNIVQIINNLETDFKEIQTLNGYNTDLGNNVFYSRDSRLAKNEYPALIFRDTAIDYVDDSEYQKMATFEIILIFKGDNCAKDVNQGILDVLTVCENAEKNYDIVGMRPISIEKETDHEGEKISAALITIGVEYYEERWRV